ncbi:hypothetical protein HCH_05558 [Hahella chejuensis KCTC 2396]|uniref:Uncharacterized protein n=1 Tax=Hahella chejuensis (strain KCTC 2396) TaxID=349521 RepID=Q2SAV7_HAHCH|nr:hypothetical protein HCH_05558 [Hahella chejuensis KCTC 2396]
MDFFHYTFRTPSIRSATGGRSSRSIPIWRKTSDVDFEVQIASEKPVRNLFTHPFVFQLWKVLSKNRLYTFLNGKQCDSVMGILVRQAIFGNRCRNLSICILRTAAIILTQHGWKHPQIFIQCARLKKIS